MSESFDLTFLGFRLTKSSTGGISIQIPRRTGKRMRVRVRELTLRSWGSSLGACIERVNQYLRGWMGYFRLCTSWSSFGNFDAHIRRRLRALIACQKKRRRHLFRHLLRRGVPRGMAFKTACQIRGHWERSRSFGMHSAYRNEWFATRLLDLKSLWEDLHSLSAPKQPSLF